MSPDAVAVVAMLDGMRHPDVGRPREGTYTDVYRLFRNHPRAMAAVAELAAAGVLEHASNGYLHRPPRKAPAPTAPWHDIERHRIGTR